MDDSGSSIWGLIGAGVFALASTYGLLLLLLSEDWGALKYWSVSAGVIVGYIISFFTFANWIIPRLVWWYDSVRNVATRTENVRIWEAAERMSEDQIAAMYGVTPIIHWIGGENGPIEYLSLGEGRGDVPMWFVRSFFEASSANYCIAVREFSEGTHERTWAQQMTEYLCAKNLADPAAGNLAAAWRGGIAGRDYAAIWCGVMPPKKS